MIKDFISLISGLHAIFYQEKKRNLFINMNNDLKDVTNQL